jgi:hypothetical protein
MTNNITLIPQYEKIISNSNEENKTFIKIEKLDIT